MSRFFDKDKFISNFIGMEDLSIEIIQTFNESIPSLISAIEKAIREKNSKDLEISAHTLKGAVSNFYAESTRLLAFKLEELGRNKNFDGVDEIFKDLTSELNQLLGDLKEFSKGIL